MTAPTPKNAPDPAPKNAPGPAPKSVTAPAPQKGYLPGFATAVCAGLVLVVLAALSVRPGGEAQRDAARSDDTIVATLQGPTRQYSPALRASLRASRADPGNPDLAKAAARQLISEGRQLGDSRLVGGAIGILRPFMENPDAETLYLAAEARQYQHDFTGALGLLDRAIAQNPRDINSLLSRATIRTVLGQFDRASADCRAIVAQQRLQVGLLCQATTQLLTAQAPGIGRQLDALLVQPGRLDPALESWALGLSGEIAALQGNDDKARKRFEAVLAATPSALRERLLLADLLLRQGAPAEVLDLLESSPDVDGVLVRRVLAARRLDQPAIAAPATQELARRVQLNLDLDLTAHAREETMYFLWIADDPAMALARARVNWDLQHEVEDAQLLIDAARAADKVEAATPVLDWMKTQDVTAPSLRIPPALKDARP